MPRSDDKCYICYADICIACFEVGEEIEICGACFNKISLPRHMPYAQYDRYFLEKVKRIKRLSLKK